MPKSEAGSVEAFHVFVEGEWRAYWMHLLALAKSSLGAVDGFLRRTWLECCGHLSAFTIGGVRYSSSPMRDFGDRGMSSALSRVVQAGTKFFYEYDFGSTTNLRLSVVGMWETGKAGGGIRLLARNDPPQILCDACGEDKHATHVCSGCVWSKGGWLCDECAPKHKCGEDMLLPVMNSPRVGVCGYTG